jgi:tripartite-type tricarboxylate transporter receptor subunit TctC
MGFSRAFGSSLVAILWAFTVAAADAQDFYKGKTLTIIVGFTAGGGFDINARLLARHIGRHIPGEPTIVVQNMPGAAGIKSAQYLDTAAPKDGTVIDIFNFGSIGDSKLDPERTRIDFRKFNWIGSISQDLTVCNVWHAFGPKTLAELETRSVVHMGRTAVGSSSDLNAHILKNIFGVHIQQVSGYPGSAEERIALERREIDAICSAWSSVPAEWVESGKVIPITRSAPVVAPDLSPRVPYVVDIAPSDRDRQIIRLLVASGQVGRPFIASLAVPPERVRILRDAFNATVADPEFIAEAQKIRLPVSPMTGEQALGLVKDIYATPPDIVEAAKKVASD